MNRREFTASLAAVGLMPALPIAAPAAAATAPTVPAGAYAWAHLIARAQTKCSPAMLARQLHLSPQVAKELFRTMVADGVLKAPGVAGVAQAVKPMNATGIDRGLAQRLRSNLSETLQEAAKPKPQSDPAPLANSDDPCLGYDDIQPEDQSDASTNQYVQESPQRG
jgi:hypothetical protein